MKRFFLICLAFVYWVGLFSCQEINEPGYNSLDISQFPMSVGSWWKYNIIDTLIYTYTGETEINYDVVKVTIVDSTVLPHGKSATIWQYKYKDKTDTLFASICGDTILFYRKNGNYLSIKFGFLFPLDVDNEWQLSGRDYKVFLSEVVKVPAGIFKSVFNAREHERQGNTLGWNNYFIVHRVGIIKYKYNTFVTLSEVNHKIEWKLLSYHIID